MIYMNLAIKFISPKFRVKNIILLSWLERFFKVIGLYYVSFLKVELISIS